MARKKICDCCSKPGAKLTQVQILVFGDIEPDRFTETTAEQDLCDTCRDGECDKMLTAAKVSHHAKIKEKASG